MSGAEGQVVDYLALAKKRRERALMAPNLIEGAWKPWGGDERGVIHICNQNNLVESI